MTITFPKTVRICHLDFTIKEVDQNWDGEAQFGECDVARQTITVKRHLPSDAFTCEVFIHECLHAYYALANLTEGDTEERVVNALGVGITQLLRDNRKWLIPLLEEATK